MRPAPVLILVALLLAGCIGLPSHEDQVLFTSPGAFDRVVEAGAKVLKAREDPGVRGQFFPSLPMTSPELDAAWGDDGHYALSSVHWWGPPGPPTTEESGHVTLEVPPDWQGFRIGRGQMQVILGDVPEETAREWFDDLMQNISRLPPEEREDIADQLFGDCSTCTMPTPDGIDVGPIWEELGGLEVADQEEPRVGSGRLSIGSWWFWFDWAEATLDRGLWFEQTSLRVGANHVVEFAWQSGRTHSDEASWQKLDETLNPIGIDTPDPADLEWVHQEIYYDI